MKHLGDITQIDWSIVDPVDCVTGGSPCQDLSQAGLRAGLAGERSGLYMEQIKCVKELRKADEQRGRAADAIRPRFMVWENVPGAYSSNKGKDFAAVLTEAVRVVEPSAPDVPVPEKGWPYSGVLYDELGRWSVAWRTHDAQHWGVPQRRKRISLVCDFGGLTAGEILFERQGVCWDPPQSRAAGEEAAARVGGGADCTSYALRMRSGCPGGGKGPLIQTEKSGTLGTGNDQTIFQNVARAYSFDSLASNSMKSKNPHSGCRVVDLAKTLDTSIPDPSKNQGGIAILEPITFPGVGRNQLVYENHGQDSRITGPLEVGPTVAAKFGTGGNNTPLVLGNGQANQTVSEVAGALNCMHDQQAGYCPHDAMFIDTSHADDVVRTDTISAAVQARDFKGGKLVYCPDNAYALSVKPQMKYREDMDTLVVQDPVCIDCRNDKVNGVSATLQSKPNGGQSLNYTNPVYAGIVRRLTPLECERLQGYPDGWTDIGEWVDSKGKKHKPADSPRYKALGNSIALPFWRWLLARISAQYRSYTPTLGSLFDGIGGFPLCWESINGKGTARWASEIEEFPMAVTKIRFKEEHTKC